MVTKKQLAARRQRNQALAVEDASHRCAVCKRPFSECGEMVEDFLVRGRCCSDDCLSELLRKAGRSCP